MFSRQRRSWHRLRTNCEISIGISVCHFPLFCRSTSRRKVASSLKYRIFHMTLRLDLTRLQITHGTLFCRRVDLARGKSAKCYICHMALSLVPTRIQTTHDNVTMKITSAAAHVVVNPQTPQGDGSFDQRNQLIASRSASISRMPITMEKIYPVTSQCGKSILLQSHGGALAECDRTVAHGLISTHAATG